jgi:hypothetical protein
MVNKRVVLINSFCDKQNKIDVLEKNIKLIKDNNLDIILLSPINLPQYIIDLCDVFIQTKENPVTKWPEKTMFEYWAYCMNNKTYELYLGKLDYGWASLYQVKKLSQIALTYQYEYFFHIIYDTIIDENLINTFLTNEKCVLFPSNKGFEIGGFFMGFNRDTLDLFQNMITKDLYYKNHDVAETLLTKISKVLPCKVETYNTSDEIYFFENLDLFNFSNYIDFKFFLHKRTLADDDTAKIFFYDLVSEYNIIVEVNNNIINQVINNHYLMDLNIHHDNIYSLSITYNGITQNLIHLYNNISHNKIIITDVVDCNNPTFNS